MVGGTGTVYEGRGWEICADKDIEFDQYHQRSIDIAYIGRYGGKIRFVPWNNCYNRYFKY